MTSELTPVEDKQFLAENTYRVPGVSWQLKNTLKDVVANWGQRINVNGVQVSEAFLELESGRSISIHLSATGQSDAEQMVILGGLRGVATLAEDVVLLPPTKKNPGEIYWDRTVDPELTKNALRKVDKLGKYTRQYEPDTNSRIPLDLPIKDVDSALTDHLECLGLDKVEFSSLPLEIKTTLWMQSVENLANYLDLDFRFALQIMKKAEKIYEETLIELELTADEARDLTGDLEDNFNRRFGEKYSIAFNQIS